MLNTILGKKIKMSQTFVGNTRVPVTVVEADPMTVTQIKSEKKDGYDAVQVGFGTKRIKNVTKPLQGHMKKVIKDGIAPRYLGEIENPDKDEVKVGDKIKVSEILSEGDKVKVTGVSKGKGFQGVMKRWNFKGGPRTHGQSDRPRSPGSIGQGTTPGRVWKGKKMAGKMGHDQVSVKNLKVVSIDEATNTVELSGPVPGPNGSKVIIKKIS